jgi:hypothetical protein
MKFTVKNTCPRELDLKVQVRDVVIARLMHPLTALPFAFKDIFPAVAENRVMVVGVR